MTVAIVQSLRLIVVSAALPRTEPNGRPIARSEFEMIPVAVALAVASLGLGAVRTNDSRIAATIRYLIAGSRTFVALADRIHKSDLIVYVNEGRCAAPQIRSCLNMIGNGGGHRYLRILIAFDDDPYVMAAQIAHELQHAAEIAEAPALMTARSLAAHYRVIGYQSGPGDTFETDEAIRVQKLVVRELHAAGIRLHGQKD